MNVVYAERAGRDIGEIYDAIARRSPATAQRVEDFIRSSCEGLIDFPYASATTDELNVRRLPLVRYPYTVFFRIDDKRGLVEIARVIHSARVANLGSLPEDD